MARVVRALPMATRLTVSHHDLRPIARHLSLAAFPSSFSPELQPLLRCRKYVPFPARQRAVGAPLTTIRGFRKSRRKVGTNGKSLSSTKRELELDVRISLEEGLPDDPEVLSIAKMMTLNAPMAMKIAFDGLRDSRYKTRDTSLDDVGKFQKVELSILLCNDDFICKLNKDWRGVEKPTDVLSMSQHIPNLDIPILLLGDIVISAETAARQAEERGHTLLDEIRILLVHGLLHLLGFDHEKGDEAEREMEKEEYLVLNALGWKGKGLISSAYDAAAENESIEESDGHNTTGVKKAGSLRFYKPKFKYIFCDMDGTLLNSESQVSPRNAQALKEAISRGVKVIIATGKARPAVLDVLGSADLAGEDGIISKSSPGVFLQGCLVYGIKGREIYRRNLDVAVCWEAFRYSLEEKVPVFAFSVDVCATLFDHPLIEKLHTVFHEPKAAVWVPRNILATCGIQKLLFYDTPENVKTTLEYWSGTEEDEYRVVQAQSDMVEIIPRGTSKGEGVRMLLEHLGCAPDEVMAIGDGENDIEMLQLASFGVVLENGAEKAKAVADVIAPSNDDDGVADAIYRYAF